MRHFINGSQSIGENRWKQKQKHFLLIVFMISMVRLTSQINEIYSNVIVTLTYTLTLNGDPIIFL